MTFGSTALSEAPRRWPGARSLKGITSMAGQLPKEFYLDSAPGTSDAVERICAHATNRPTEDVVAVAVAPANVAQAAELLFGTGIGIVSAFVDSHDVVDQVRRSVAQGANEIALPRMVLDQAAALQRLRSRLGPTTPVTIDLTEPGGRIDLSAAEYALRLGADFVSFAPLAESPTATDDIDNLLGLAGTLKMGGVKVATARDDHASAVHTWAYAAAPIRARLCLPVDVTSG